MQHTHPAELGRFLKSEVTTKVRKMHDIVIIKHIHFNKKTKAVGLKGTSINKCHIPTGVLWLMIDDFALSQFIKCNNLNYT